MKHQGSCHCGLIRFEVEGDIDSVTACNCSICRRKGSLMWFVPRSALRWLTSESDSKVYEFNRHAIQHRFCPTCGIHTHGEVTPPSGVATAAINARCIDGLDLEAIPVKQFDGRAM